MACSAYGHTFKALALLLVSGVFIWGWQMWRAGLLEASWAASGWLLAAMGLMLYTEWHIFRAKTSLDAQSLQQSWIWHKKVMLNELAYAKLFRMRGLEWLIAPRLYTRTYSGKLAAFYAADAAMLLEMERLAQELQVWQGRP